jgi:hypothetical protein
MTDKLVVNFFGPPNSGKSVAATSMFAQLKRKHIDAVLTTEFAHQMVVEERKTALADQIFIWANQNHRIFAANRHARVVVTDSPILLGAVYNDQDPALQQLILNQHNRYNNLNVVLELDPSYPYSMTGRVHSFSESVSIGNQIIELLQRHDLPYLLYADQTEQEIVELVEALLQL